MTLATLDARARTLQPPRPFVQVEIYRDTSDVLPIWRTLETTAMCSIYQTRAWLGPWLETLGVKAGITPLFVVARDADQVPVALLCLGVSRVKGVAIARWAGGKDANFNAPLLRPGISWTAADVTSLFQQASRLCGRDAPDLFVLRNQPYRWAEAANPLALLPRQASPSAAFGTRLPAKAEELFAAKLSKDARKKLRKKEAKLATFGPVSHVIAASADGRARIIDAFLAQKTARFRTLGIASEFDTVEMRTFIERASASGGIELHALEVGERIVSVYGGAGHRGHWSGMFNAFTADEEIARCSPGDLLLMRILERACADGLTGFDLGIGEARYKATLCDETIELFDTLVPLTLRGRFAAATIGLGQAAKRVIKQNPRLFALLRTWRATRARLAA